MIASATILAVCSLLATSESIPGSDEYDVVIVGAGLTGLSAARELKKLAPKARVKLLEARDQVGGRIRARTMRTAEGEASLDTGSHFISPTAPALSSLISELGLPLFTQTNCGTRTLDIRTKRMVESQLLTARHSFRDVLNSMVLPSWASKNVHDFLMSVDRTKPAMDTANRLLQTLFDSPDKSVSILHLILAAASENATVADLLSRYGHGQALLMHGGLNRLTRAMAENVDVELNQTVTSVEEGDSVVTVKTPTRLYTARQVIITAPPLVASLIQFSPPLQPEFAEFIETYRPTGRAHYFTMTFPSPFWRQRGKSGQIIHTNPQGPVVWLTTFDVGSPTMCAGVGATGVLWGIAHLSQEMVPTQRQAAYVNIVARALGGNGPPPLDISEDHFWTDVCSRGSIGVLPPNVDIASLRFLRGVNEHGERVLFASAEYSNVSMGLMNGAILSGKAAGTTVVRRLQDPDERDREDNEVANLVRLNDDVTKTSQPLEVTMESRRLSNSTPFLYSTSTHYPQTHPIEVITFKHFSFGNLGDVNEETGNVIENDESSIGENAGVETATEGKSFVYHTSSLNPPVESLETSTFEHFSFGNGPPMTPFVPPPRSGTPGATASFPTTTTTARSTFTPRDLNRHTTPFQYHTSTINTPLEPAEAVSFEHFSSGNVGEALSDPANDVELLTSKEDIIRRLKEVLDEAPTSSSLQLAKQLAAVLHGLLQAMREERR